MQDGEGDRRICEKGRRWWKHFLNLRCPFVKKINSLWRLSLRQAASACAAYVAVRTGGPAGAQESTFPLCYIFNKAKHAENHFPPNYHISSHYGPFSRAAVAPLILHIPLQASSETYGIQCRSDGWLFATPVPHLLSGARLQSRGLNAWDSQKGLGRSTSRGCHHMFVVMLLLLLWRGLTMQHGYSLWKIK